MGRISFPLIAMTLILAAGTAPAQDTGAADKSFTAVRTDAIHAGTTIVTRGNESLMPFPSSVIIVDDDGTPVAMPESGADGSNKGPNNRGPNNREGA